MFFMWKYVFDALKLKQLVTPMLFIVLYVHFWVMKCIIWLYNGHIDRIQTT